MNSDPDKPADASAKPNMPEPKLPGAQLDVSDASTPIEVPVFNCIVYVSEIAEGGVRARVANLADICCDAGSEREALGKIVPTFKQRVAELTASGTLIPWIDPPLPAEPDEQTRFVPVHL
jgi:hypothetical protein